MFESKQVLSIVVENQPGVLSRIVGLFSGRGYNIDSLCVAPTHDSKVSRITIVTQANAPMIEQIEKQLNKLISVIKVNELSSQPSVMREMALVCVKARSQHRAEVLRIADIFRCKVVDVGPEHFTLEVTGDEGKLAALIKLLEPIGIKKIARTGLIALTREINGSH